MMQTLHNRKGTTLVELIVCLALMGLFTLAAVALVRPSAQAFMTIQQQTRAQNLADALIEGLRGDVLDADGYIRFAVASDAADPDRVFTYRTGDSYQDGTALEFNVPTGQIELVDSGYIPVTSRTDAAADPWVAEPIEPGYLHKRYFVDEEKAGPDGTAYKGNPQHLRKDADGNLTGEETAYAFTSAYADNAYMGMTIGELHFYARGWAKDADGTVRLTSLTVVLTISDSTGNPLCTQKAIIPLPGRPELLYQPGTWQQNKS